MRVVDSSVILAILLDEPGSVHLRSALLETEFVVPAPVVVEAGLRFLVRGFEAAETRGFVGSVVDLGGRIEPFTQEMAEAALVGFAAYGKSRGHPASLNFGDAQVYGAAKVLDLPLLFKGEDFQHTDIRIDAASQDARGKPIGSNHD